FNGKKSTVNGLAGHGSGARRGGVIAGDPQAAGSFDHRVCLSGRTNSAPFCFLTKLFDEAIAEFSGSIFQAKRIDVDLFDLGEVFRGLRRGSRPISEEQEHSYRGRMHRREETSALTTWIIGHEAKSFSRVPRHGDSITFHLKAAASSKHSAGH